MPRQSHIFREDIIDNLRDTAARRARAPEFGRSWHEFTSQAPSLLSPGHADVEPSVAVNRGPEVSVASLFRRQPFWYRLERLLRATRCVALVRQKFRLAKNHQCPVRHSSSDAAPWLVEHGRKIFAYCWLEGWNVLEIHGEILHAIYQQQVHIYTASSI